MNKVFIGIDPGLDGAIVKLYHDGSWGYTIMPTIAVGKGREVDLDRLFLAMLCPEDKSPIIAVEKVHSMPGQGVASTFKFGKCYGIILGIMAAINYPRIEVAPQTWKKAMMPDMQKNKEAAIYRAKQLITIGSGILDGIKNKKHRIAVAEAYLMARYAQRMEG
jgi:crossover junction endodeoxyribonuclease RuvC